MARELTPEELELISATPRTPPDGPWLTRHHVNIYLARVRRRNGDDRIRNEDEDQKR
jgi:hypothetical protein